MGQFELPVIESCDQCGLCCMHLNVPPFSGDSWDDPPAELQAEIDAYVSSPRFRDEPGPCLWLDLSTGKCRHYEDRPGCCESFERGNATCRMLRNEAGLPA